MQQVLCKVKASKGGSSTGGHSPAVFGCLLWDQSRRRQEYLAQGTTLEELGVKFGAAASFALTHEELSANWELCLPSWQQPGMEIKLCFQFMTQQREGVDGTG